MIKKQLVSLGCTLASIILLAGAGALEAYQPVSDFSLTGGWRRDNVRVKIGNDDSSFCGYGYSDGSGYNDVSSTANTSLKFDGLNIWQFGIRGQYALDMGCDCDDWYLNQFFVKGNAIWGWGDDGKVKGSFSNTGSDYDFSGNITLGHAHKTRSYDYNIGLGWMYPICDEWAIGPTVGYSWDKLTIHAKQRNGRTSYDYSSDSSSSFADFSSDDYYDVSGSGSNGAQFVSRFYGPWLGFDVAYEACEWRMNAGYEYHWARWRGGFNVPGTESDHKKLNTKFGNQFYVNAYYDFCECWELGLGFKYSYFKSSSHKRHHRIGSLVSVTEGGSSSSDFAYISADDSYGANSGSHIHDTSWQSWGITVDVGYRF